MLYYWSNMEKVNLQDAGVLEKAVDVLRAGGVVMHPTETCYGLAVDISNRSALEKLYKLKGRDANKPVSILVADIEMALKYGEFSKKALMLAEKYWPGPLSIVVPQGEGSVSMRVSGEEFCRELPKLFGGAVTTTSANLAGEPPLYEANVNVFGELVDMVDLVVDGGKLRGDKPTTIVKDVGGELVVLREGGLKIEHKN